MRDLAWDRISFIRTLDLNEVAARRDSIGRRTEPRKFGMHEKTKFQNLHSKDRHGLIAHNIFVLTAVTREHIPFENIMAF